MGSLTASRNDLGPMTLMIGGHGSWASARRSGSDFGRRNCQGEVALRAAMESSAWRREAAYALVQVSVRKCPAAGQRS